MSFPLKALSARPTHRPNASVIRTAQQQSRWVPTRFALRLPVTSNVWAPL
jgi:hypothetical protein